ncbi:unnamed protein product [Cyprideis torosa]|uniref:N-acetyltransferase domain-containing protein n=1 Tax=Cyprideis torosa TaxID=163714 RepID=A0A7R8WML5_9CRUS|nr:unnamed protein product [Cyprideis torosa]CAG0905410.1 unnamed protein product [Cyprideis torosa]
MLKGLTNVLRTTGLELQRQNPHWFLGFLRCASTNGASTIEYRPPESRDFEPTLELLKHVFTTREPITMGLHVDKADFESWAPRAVDEMFQQHVSLVARDTSTDLLVGFQLSEIETPNSTTGFNAVAQRCHNPRFQKLFRLLKDLDRLADPYNRFGVDKLFRLRMIAVHDDYLKQGIGKELFKRSVDDVFPTSGCEMAVSECTGIQSQRLFRKNGFQAVAHIDYAYYTVDGDRMLDLIKVYPHSCVKFFARESTACFSQKLISNWGL